MGSIPVPGSKTKILDAPGGVVMLTGEVTMPFFLFNQNNSGGSFVFDAERGISHVVFIEASCAEAAKYRAETVGLYFDGCFKNIDCSCCGDRWYPIPIEVDPPTPRQAFAKNPFCLTKWLRGPEGFIHFADGRIEPTLV